MTLSTLAMVAAVIAALGSVAYVWWSMVSGGGTGDGASGTDGASVLRFDLESHGYVAQVAHEELGEAGIATRVVTLEQGAFGIGLGDRYYLVFSAEDRAEVQAVIGRLLDDHGLADEVTAEPEVG